MYARALGANVIALDVREEQLQACKGQNGTGAIHTINTVGLKGSELEGRVRKLNNGNLLGYVIITIGAILAYTSSFPLVAPEGRLIAVGVPPDAIPVSSQHLQRHSIR